MLWYEKVGDPSAGVGDPRAGVFLRHEKEGSQCPEATYQVLSSSAVLRMRYSGTRQEAVGFTQKDFTMES